MKQAIVLLVNGSFPNGQLDFAKDNAVKALELKHISATALRLELNNPNAVMYALGRIAWFSRDVLDPKTFGNGSDKTDVPDEEQLVGFKQWWKKEGFPSVKKFAKDVWRKDIGPEKPSS